MKHLSRRIVGLMALVIFLLAGLYYNHHRSAQNPTVLAADTATCTTKPTGDANCDGRVDVIDFEQWRKEFQHDLTTHDADFNGDGAVTSVDFEIWRKTRFGAANPSTAPPGTSPTPTMSMPMGSRPADWSHAMGLWTPSSYDTCTKEFHDSYSVIGPDGKRYPTWHPPTAVDPKTGKSCTFGHEHGRDPSSFPDFSKLQEYFAYDQNHDGVISPAEKSQAGIPFGYVNEQLDVYTSAKGTPTLMRHEDHVGHKIEWEAQGDLFIHAGPGDQSRRSMAKCNYFAKVHQGTHSKDAFSNNLHEVFSFIDCPTENYDVRTARMVSFGAPGEFSRAVPCDPRGEVVPVGYANTNQAYPGRRGDGAREIGHRDCANANFLVANNKFSGNFYEIWSGDSSITASNGTILSQSPTIQFASFNPIRFFDPGKPDNVGHLIDLCYETEANGDRARGGVCGDIQNKKPIPWDSPESPFTDSKRETYFSAGPIHNAGGSTVWYADPFGRNAQATPFPGSVKEYIGSVSVDLGKKYNGVVDTSAYGSVRDYGGNGVHAPN